MEAILNGYLLIHPWILTSCAGLVSYHIRNWPLSSRWIVGLIAAKTAQFCQNYSNAAWKSILPIFVVDHNASLWWLLFNSSIGMLFANAVTPLFGGNQYYIKRGIDSYTKSVIASICHGSVYFKKNPNARFKAISNILETVSIFFIGAILSMIIQYKTVADIIESNVMVHMEVLGLLFSFCVYLPNIQCNVHYFIFSANDDIQVIEPFDFAYFSKSIRIFWKNWSRPVGEMLRYMIYIPLGSRKRYWLSVPLVFMVNAQLHFDWSMNLYGYYAFWDWTKAFAIMALSITFFVFTENLFSNYKETLLWRMWSLVLFHGSMTIALYIVREKAMIVNLKNCCGTFLWKL